jgi:hypothetical protein
VVQVEVAKQDLLMGLIVVQYCANICQYGAVALAASRRVVYVVYGKVLSLLSIVAELHCERADVSAVFLELPLPVV